MAKPATLELFGEPAYRLQRDSYGDDCPAWMRPEHHPDYRPLPAVNLKPAAHPEDRPFRFAKGWTRPAITAATVTRLKKLPTAKRWTGEYPDAPPSGQDGKRNQVWSTENGLFIFGPMAPRGYAAEVYDPTTKKYVVPATTQYPRHGFVPVRAKKVRQRKAA